MTPVRHIPAPRPLTATAPGEGLPGVWRYSSHLALVLGGGGARGAYQVGVLAGLAERLPGLEFPILTGMSVGAINTMFLAAHRGPLLAAVKDLRLAWKELTADAVFRLRPGSLVGTAARWMWRSLAGKQGAIAVRGLADTAPLRDFLTHHVDPGGVAANLERGRLRAVALSATSYTTGRSVTFVQGTVEVPPLSGAHRAAVPARLTLDHVMASAAVPIVFPAVRIGDEFYGDGSVRQMAPLAPALHLGARSVLAIGLSGRQAAARGQSVGAADPQLSEALGLLFRAIFLDALEADAERLEAVNHLIAALPPGVSAPRGLRTVELLLLHPTRDLSALAAGRSDLLPAELRHLIRATGGDRDAASEFLGFLLFHPEHTNRLIEAGYDDVATQWPVIERFFERLEHRAM